MRIPSTFDSSSRLTLALLGGALAAGALAPSFASAPVVPPQDEEGGAAAEPTGPITAALQAVDDDVRIYNDHLTILASPWMEGRLPGTRGMELAKEYVEHYFAEAGLEKPYGEGEAASYRQPFDLGETVRINKVDCHADAAGRTLGLSHGADADFTLTGLGRGTEIDGELAFVGYGIEKGPDGTEFTSFAEGEDLTGKVCVMLRFEPMDDGGWSRWRDDEGWTRRAQFVGKLRATAKRGARAIIVVNPPGSADARANSLIAAGSSSRALVDIPVLHMSTAAGSRLVELASVGAHSLAEFTARANEGVCDLPFQGRLHMAADISVEVATAENLVGRIAGKGALADEVIVIGAHLDHLGQGEFGSRDRNAGKVLHPGADDNASGAAGILHIARKMAADYANAPEGANLRTILFIAFSAEESGLDGSRYYAENPLVPIDQHVLMMNFDMIGRMKDSRLSLSGLGTAEGLAEFCQPMMDANPLTVVPTSGATGGSDHRSFHSKGVPVLFAIIKDFHPDYHTSRDVSYLINRVEAVQAAELFRAIATAYAGHTQRLPFQETGRRARQGRQAQAAAAADETEEQKKEREIAALRARLAELEAEKAEKAGDAEDEGAPAPAPRAATTVRLGVRPEYNDDGAGVLVGGVSDGTSAKRAGIQKGDLLISWNDKEMPGAAELGAFLREAKPGDKVKVGVVRGEKTLTVEVTLDARETGGQ